MSPLERLDHWILEELYQPAHDLISKWRQRADNLPAVVCVIASTCATFARAGASHASALVWGMCALGAFFCLLTSLFLYLHGVAHKDTTAPNLFTAYWGFRLFVLFGLALALFSAFTSDGPLAGTIRLVDQLLWVSGVYFGSCVLKRPPPIERRVSVFEPAFLGRQQP